VVYKNRKIFSPIIKHQRQSVRNNWLDRKSSLEITSIHMTAFKNVSHLSKGDHALLGSHAAALEHDEVIVDFAIVGEASHRSNALLREIVFSRGVVLDDL
jgi:hypothetical protein